MWILSPNTEKLNSGKENYKDTQISVPLCQRFRERKNERLPTLLKDLRRTVYKDANSTFNMRGVTLKGPITKPIEIQINR